MPSLGAASIDATQDSSNTDDEVALTADVIELARQYRRYGYRRVTALLRRAGWTVNKKRVERIWRCERLKAPGKQPKPGRLWLNDGSCIRLRPERSNHVWSYDFIADRTHDGNAFQMLCIIDKLARESLAIRVARKFKQVTSSRHSASRSSCEASLRTYVQTMALSSSPRRCGIGSPPSESRPLTSSRAVGGRMAIARALTASHAMN